MTLLEEDDNLESLDPIPPSGVQDDEVARVEDDEDLFFLLLLDFTELLDSSESLDSISELDEISSAPETESLSEHAQNKVANKNAVISLFKFIKFTFFQLWILSFHSRTKFANP